MKSRRNNLRIQDKAESSEQDGDCTCQLLDTSLSNVGDSDCSCSQCLEANLQVFNELKEVQQLEKENKGKIGPGSTTRRRIEKPRGVSKNQTQNQQKTKIRINDYRSIDKMRQTRPKTSINHYTSKNELYAEESLAPNFSRQCINDYIKITQHRAREYLNQRKRLQIGQIQERKRLKQMIKQNLQALKFTVKSKFGPENEEKNDGEQYQPHYRWDHQPYHCKSRIECKKTIPYNPDLQNKKEQIDKIYKRIKNYEQKHKEQPHQCPDQCPNHHMRTSKKKLAEIEKYIKKKAQAYENERIKAKAELQQKQKIKAAKLRAIDIRCRDIAAKSKKYDPNISRTSFHNSIDHFSTFSDLRQHHFEKIQEKERRNKVKKAMKQKGGILQEKIYQNLSDSLVGDHPPIHSKIGAESYNKGHNEESEQEVWCEKIVREAKIKPPKEVKKDDKFKKSAFKDEKKQITNIKDAQKPTKEKKVKKQHQAILKKQEQKRKQIQRQIEKKKEQIFKEYKKRNSTTNRVQDPKNKKIRIQYEQSIKVQKSPSHRQTGSKRQQQYNPYRQVYQHQPSKDPKQLKIVGDPLLEQYEYQKNVGRLKEFEIDQDHEIFTKSGTSLKNRQFLKV